LGERKVGAGMEYLKGRLLECVADAVPADWKTVNKEISRNGIVVGEGSTFGREQGLGRKAGWWGGRRGSDSGEG